MVLKLLVLLELLRVGAYQMSYEAGVLSEGNVKDDEFGKVVSISGNVLIVGAPAEDINGTDAGGAYVYKLVGNIWTLDARIVSEDIAAGDRFGNSLKVEGDYIIVGADGHDSNGLADTGSAYIFSKNSDSWVQQAKLVGDDTMAGDKFGISVSMTENYAVVGADWHTGPGGVGCGAAYIFAFNGSSWNQEAQLLPDDSAAFDRFGGAVSIFESTVIVGAVESEENGAAYVFERNGDQTWSQLVKYVADSNTTDTDRFASAVALSGDTAVVGAFWDDGEKVNGGAVYIYTWNSSGWGTGTKIYAPDGANEEDRFGISVDVSGNTMIVGAYFTSESGVWSGSAYIFAQLAIGQWSFQEKVTWSGAAASHYFGRGVSIWDSNVGPFTAVVGAPGANSSIVLEGGLPTTSTTTTSTSSTSSSTSKTASTSTTTSSTKTSSSSVSSSTSITTSTSMTSTTSMTSSSLTSSSTSVSQTTSTSSSVTLTTSTSSSHTRTSSTMTLTTKTTLTTTSTSQTTTSFTTTSSTRTSATTTESTMTTTASTSSASTTTSQTQTSTSVSVTKTSLRVTSSSTAPPSLSMKEDFGTGIDYSSGSWTWEEYDSAAFHLRVPLVLLLWMVH
ncbi:unnamed protein product [Durusdinium trenchii]|uniref:Uncharacterized protein n=2 Tax=Durusdinium trenchii TaxID=1381693 RepID=A0ABP0HEK5_9DINO